MQDRHSEASQQQRSTGRIGMIMNYIYIYIAGCLVAGFVSAAMTDFRVSNEVKNNEFSGYHCAPITKHIGLESAKKQVEINQARVAAATRD